ncbi:COX15/CtaA family protein [Flavilitoribacter nigricans]|uniref:Heme A synthase n=1 Tax=Flavilitoribacter nigricans (strain ATCC 23147 / DSM 23189 / NBRC 102662 / NCIMB 1420 / SS-2) TaxID=1122177 RepID=A0A2D0N569_FLAN2|nr:COX15/CtaA family protein [Flavilitoribacter nigricans]PHN03682.1 heme A synthase [Flavilitoribacter nigricans DSM 23189 = NBRC 102662]
MAHTSFKYKKAVKVWLIIGLVMIFFQVVIGGVTRLTGSGLSITKWEIVTGTVPPLNHAQWQEEFELYQQTPQYQKINEGMSLSDFKFIYFWEYFHRLWARSMGFVFLFPFLFFWAKGWIDKPLMRRLGVTVLLAAVVASFGWIMVASGLVDRPWVNAYKLTIHLSLALILFSYLLWTTYLVVFPEKRVIHNKLLKSVSGLIIVILSVQIILGGIMSGMKAGLFYPSWPDMNGSYLPAVLLNSAEWNVDNFVHYDSGPFMAALIQFLHRNTAYLLTIIVLWFSYRAFQVRETKLFRTSIYLLVSMLIIQVLLGIFTLINCVGNVPVGLGVMHQAGALLLLTIVLFVRYQMRPGKV